MSDGDDDGGHEGHDDHDHDGHDHEHDHHGHHHAGHGHGHDDHHGDHGAGAHGHGHGGHGHHTRTVTVKLAGGGEEEVEVDDNGYRVVKRSTPPIGTDFAPVVGAAIGLPIGLAYGVVGLVVSAFAVKVMGGSSLVIPGLIFAVSIFLGLRIGWSKGAEVRLQNPPPPKAK